jgi:hypothetical protein
MAKRTRKNTKSVYERIEETLVKIEETEKVLSDLRELLDELYAEKDDLEMRQTWSKINSIGLSMDDINKLLSENMLAQLKSNSDTKAKENSVDKKASNKPKKDAKIEEVDNVPTEYVQEQIAI